MIKKKHHATIVTTSQASDDSRHTSAATVSNRVGSTDTTPGSSSATCAGVNLRKVAIIGCGFVGSASAFSLMQSGLFSEMVLIDADRAKAEGEAMDIGHGIPFARPMKIYAGSYDDLTDAAIIILTAGAGQKPGETRLDLVHKNVGIFQSILPELSSRNCQGILLVVANPVDVLTYTAQKLSGFPRNRVIGSGTVLDTARLKYQLSQHLSVDSRSVHAFIIGEHGDSAIAAWSSANISGIPLPMKKMRKRSPNRSKTVPMRSFPKSTPPITASPWPSAGSAKSSSGMRNPFFPFLP